MHFWFNERWILIFDWSRKIRFYYVQHQNGRTEIFEAQEAQCTRQVLCEGNPTLFNRQPWLLCICYMVFLKKKYCFKKFVFSTFFERIFKMTSQQKNMISFLFTVFSVHSLSWKSQNIKELKWIDLLFLRSVLTHTLYRFYVQSCLSSNSLMLLLLDNIPIDDFCIIVCYSTDCI